MSVETSENKVIGKFENNHDFAARLDSADKLSHFRGRFCFPQFNGKDVLYFTGNSLGLQPKKVRDYIVEELDDWAQHGVEGHMTSRRPWFSYHEQLTDSLAEIVGANSVEVVAMNQLTVNLHLMMASFYNPTKERFKIICEAKAFPSDQYVLETQARFHGFDPLEAIIEIQPREGSLTIEHDDIINAINDAGNSLALILIGGVNYFTGQVFDMKSITAAAHAVGAFAGFDLAHAAGNLKLELHNWNVDFAAWCSYKYLNSGPGGVAGVFVHERHSDRKDLNRFGGWWGHDKGSRFQMNKGFVPIPGAEGWQLSNAPVLSMAAHLASLEIFHEAGMDNLVEKSKVLTAYLDYIISDLNRELEGNKKLQIITTKERGCQLSIIADYYGKDLFYSLHKKGVVADWREPNVIRLAPVPLYNSFMDIYQFGVVLREILIK